MKTNNKGNQNGLQNRNNKRPENKDNLDSREGEEQLFKGDDMTHNKKDRHSEGSGKKKI